MPAHWCCMPRVLVGQQLVALVLLGVLGHAAAQLHWPPSTQLAPGIPMCPPSFAACGAHGCYAKLLHKCNPHAGCAPAGLLASVSNLVRQGFSSSGSGSSGSGSSSGNSGSGSSGSGGGTAVAAWGRCPVAFANACGAMFCGSNEVCSSAGSSQARCARTAPDVLQLSSSRAASAGASAHTACLAARGSLPACAGDSSPLAAVADCNSMGVASLPGVLCFESERFLCAVAPGAAAHYSCRGLAGMAQALTGVVNTTLSTAAVLSAAAKSMLTKEQQQQIEAQLQQLQQPMQEQQALLPPPSAGAPARERQPGGAAAATSVPTVASKWVQELEQLGQTVKQHTQQLQPLFHNLAEASKSVLNRTSWTAEMGSGNGSGSSAMRANQRQPAFDLGPPPLPTKSGGSALAPLVHLVLLAASVAAVMLHVL